MSGVGGWRSADAERRFRAMEDELWRDRGVPDPDVLDVDTTAGTTRVYRWSGDGEPIVFLHGMGGTGLTWAAYVERLTGRDVYAIDTIGDVGRSRQLAPLIDANDLAGWLDESLAGAGIGSAHIVGTSYGAFAALRLAIRRPARVASLTLIDAGGLVPLRPLRFMLWGVPMLLGCVAPAPLRQLLARRRPMLRDPRVMRMALLGQLNHSFRLPKPEPLSDHELRSITAPTSVLVAGHSAPFEPKEAARRGQLIPGAAVDVIPKAGHDLSWTHVDQCLASLANLTNHEINE